LVRNPFAEWAWKFTLVKVMKERYANGRITFEVKLEPGEKWKANCNYILADNQHVRKPANLSYESAVDLNVVNTEIERLHCQWINSVTDIEL